MSSSVIKLPTAGIVKKTAINISDYMDIDTTKLSINGANAYRLTNGLIHFEIDATLIGTYRKGTIDIGQAKNLRTGTNYGAGRVVCNGNALPCTYVIFNGALRIHVPEDNAVAFVISGYIY